MTVNGEHAWRPADLVAAKTLPSGEFLVAAWDFGGLAHSCPIEILGQPTVFCPGFEGLADQPGGSSVITLAWRHVPVQQAPALVVRVTVEPPPVCISDPSGGCPGPMLDAIAVVWAGTSG